jgi:hypothetical protein
MHCVHQRNAKCRVRCHCPGNALRCKRHALRCKRSVFARKYDRCCSLLELSMLAAARTFCLTFLKSSTFSFGHLLMVYSLRTTMSRTTSLTSDQWLSAYIHAPLLLECSVVRSTCGNSHAGVACSNPSVVCGCRLLSVVR